MRVHMKTRNGAVPLERNSNNKTHYGLGVSRSEVRGVECKRDWNTEEDCLPSVKKEIGAVTRLLVGQMLDESRWLDSLTGAKVATRSNQWLHSANN